MTLFYYDRNLSNIEKLADRTKEAAIKWHNFLVENDINILIYETKRTQEQQRSYVQSGASQTMRSYHLVGQALDFVPVNDKGETLWNGYGHDDVKKAIIEAKRLGFEWGGDWKSFVDKPHLQFNHRGYGTDTFGKYTPNVTFKKASLPEPEKVFFYTGGYHGDSLKKIHDFLYETKFWYVPTRNDSGALSFKVGAFTNGTEKFNKMKKFLDDMNAWYSLIRE